MYILFFLIIFFSSSLYCQENLIINPSLENWKNEMPVDWKVIDNTVELCKSNFVVTPRCAWNDSLRHLLQFPTSGHHGLSYFGINFAEIIQCKLIHSLAPEKIYQLTFWVYRPNFPSSISTNKLSVKFTNTSNQSINNNNEDNWKPGILYRNINNYITVYKKDRTEFSQKAWTEAKVIFKASGSENFLLIGFFEGYNPELGLNSSLVYYLFDDFRLIELNEYSDTLSLYFKHDNFQLDQNQIGQLKRFYKKHHSVDSINISSYSNELGDSLYNQNLSDQRNESVNDELKKLKINTPIRSISNGDRFSRNRNLEHFRRTDLICYYGNEIEEQVENSFKGFDTSLMLKLKLLEFKDQDVRRREDSIFTLNPKDSSQLRALDQEMIETDSMNLKEMIAILDEYGYPGISLASTDYMNVAFIILQHAPLAMREKYFNLIVKAVDQGEMDKSLLPMMIDRNHLDKGEKQIYGTQLTWNKKTNKFELLPVKDPKNLNELRKKYCLGKVEDYLNSFNGKIENKK